MTETQKTLATFAIGCLALLVVVVALSWWQAGLDQVAYDAWIAPIAVLPDEAEATLAATLYFIRDTAIEYGEDVSTAWVLEVEQQSDNIYCVWIYSDGELVTGWPVVDNSLGGPPDLCSSR